jgi:hypothetical protein
MPTSLQTIVYIPNDGKGVALYAAMDNVSIQTKPEGGALPTLLEKWIEQVILNCRRQQYLIDIRNEQYLKLIYKAI